MADRKLRPRARDLGIEIGSLETGSFNAITDVPGVRVGQVSLFMGEGMLRPGEGPVRTGVTAIVPHPGNLYEDKVCGAVHVINGYGKSVGLPQVVELGSIETPILLTNTLNVWTVADALVDYLVEQTPSIRTINPVVGECNDSRLNDIVGRHVKKEHVYEALSTAGGGMVEEGAVGAGVGTQCFSWKGGIGTSSRIVTVDGRKFTVGTLVQTNTGRAENLRIDGVPVGRELTPNCLAQEEPPGSIMLIVATDVPLSSRQLTRVAKRAAFGLARTGAEADHGSGDFVLAFSTTNRISLSGKQSVGSEGFLAEGKLSLLFQAVIDCIEEAIINALLKAETVVGRDGNRLEAIPIDILLSVMKQHGRKVVGG